MFLFAQETKTPVSTYTDSYRPPNSVKKTFQEPPSLLWKENKFVTKGLAMPPVPSAGSPGQQERLLTAAAQELAYRNAVEPSAYQPEKYWVTRQEERYNPVFVNEDRYVTWRTSPYNSAAWNKYTTYLPRLPKEAKMEALLESAARPEHLHRCEREVADMLGSLRRAPPPAAPHVYAAAARRPYQGYFSPCSGRHYCLRGMDYYGDVGRPDTGRHLHPLAERAVRWDSSHFKKAGGVQRGTFTIHPEFVSESCSAPWGY
ncbi:spermatid-specific manchette-related protein 1 [Nothoprocta perdicaria]|uniref:spermatid-specific manchette-related protein 1 n=1 Tax=Nothoprocta perdicaria TaxID=30464 RepID=UPI000E1C1902|nr:spermatid-specific manchette-related protein 1 [Nothoprocta perdicaria]